ncbi:TBCC domain-containing protein 1 [Petromyzon marinus]|uniref:TBCC domain-containing protein 1 n=1 Tax=Petromyzon marinus TaxID=7757 RepID=UPI003F716E2B
MQQSAKAAGGSGDPSRAETKPQPQAPRVRLWLRDEPFRVGVLPMAPPTKLGVYYLHKVAAYVRIRPLGFPRLTWPMWRHVACGKLQLPEEVAWLYMESCDTLAPEWTAQRRLEWAEEVSECRSRASTEQLRAQLSVDTLRFLLFLYIQELSRTSLRRHSLVAEDWPSPRGQPDDHEQRSLTQGKYLDGQQHLSFVKSGLSDLLKLLLEPAGMHAVRWSSLSESLLPLSALRTLDMLMEGSADRGQRIRPLSELATAAQADSGFLPGLKAFSLRPLQLWLRDHLNLSPYGMSACLQRGRHLSWAQNGEGTAQRACMLRSGQGTPAGARVVMLRKASRQTLARSSPRLAGAHVCIHRCSDSFIYLLSPLRSVSIERCRRTVLVLGPVETHVTVHGCEDVTVVVACRRLVASACSACTFHLLTPCRPLLVSAPSGDTGITLAPYHTHYPLLEEHMARAGLAAVPNRWDQPLCLGGPEADGTNGKCYRLLPPSELHLLTVPFAIAGGTTSEVPGGLPGAYERALAARDQSVQAWQQTMRYANLTREKTNRFRLLVKELFCEWLKDSGHQKQLDGLIPTPEQHATPP